MTSFVSICLIGVYRSTEELYSHIETSTLRNYVKDIHKNKKMYTFFRLSSNMLSKRRVQTGIGLIRGNL